MTRPTREEVRDVTAGEKGSAASYEWWESVAEAYLATLDELERLSNDPYKLSKGNEVLRGKLRELESEFGDWRNNSLREIETLNTENARMKAVVEADKELDAVPLKCSEDLSTEEWLQEIGTRLKSAAKKRAAALSRYDEGEK